MTPTNELRVLSMPAWSSTNAHIHSLCEHLQAAGCLVDEWTMSASLRVSAGNVIHLHWPFTALVRRSWPVAVAAVTRLLAAVTVARWRGAVIVYTAHNLVNHGARYRRTEAWFARWLVRLLRGWIAPSTFAEAGAIHKHPPLARLPHRVIPLGLLEGHYPDTTSRAEARAQLSLDEGARVLLFFGRVEGYKNVEGLVDCFARVGTARDALVVAGACGRELADRLRGLADRDPRVSLHLEFIPDADVQVFLKAADVVVAPYTDIVNSGTALLALSFSRPIVAPRIGALPELQATAGPEWVRLYDGPLRPEVLEAALREPAPLGGFQAPDMEWSVIASQTVSLYQAAGAR